eukprot:gb/GEZN01006249.1/.p1 GENE.gb/GEZN01006249.1/~~gb/GEZN01006249.1/.p1  ORF type:complete len:415 (+),score=39.19 gb/GEZN01006249.1/:72-1316(+)
MGKCLSLLQCQPAKLATECNGCDAKFSMFGIRKRHCRSCGAAMCSKCTSRPFYGAPHRNLSSYSRYLSHRCCEKCYEKTTQGALTTARSSSIDEEHVFPAQLRTQDSTSIDTEDGDAEMTPEITLSQQALIKKSGDVKMSEEDSRQLTRVPKPSPIVWCVSDVPQVQASINDGTNLLPPLVSMVLEYVAGHIWLGNLVDVKDQIGKWVFGRIIEVERSDTLPVGETDVRKWDIMRNCTRCGALMGKTRTFCHVCLYNAEEVQVQGKGKGEEQSEGEALIAAVSDDELPPVVGEDRDVRARISFFGWDASFDEWVTLDRVAPAGTQITAWLKKNSVICLGPKKGNCMYPHMVLMGRVLDMRRSPDSIFDVKVKWDPKVPYSSRPYIKRREATSEEVEGYWVPLTTGLIIENGSFA